ncbi:uncharacterized protein si:dkey-86e18.1 [Melanotaenia boesemani]|uniref:uncharacterized protein si:dkey-86e18.1 n=1 Tax=Melanotaenia boesemani TaxID=1250792 RepID=UPI001C03BD7B|nr:uncharacterized protein si:dkey-86e18.1 [Melanotaenia boesemani]
MLPSRDNNFRSRGFILFESQVWSGSCASEVEMARNEEKQLGKLNRLWLQKEREEGRLKDVNGRRPKLSTLHSASSVKKWIPSIKNEIEYYLQQSQLSHYPERKITEFQLHIEALEKEYKSFITKLRVLDPSCKQHPWTPRAYCKRRADTQDSSSSVKTPRLCEPDDGLNQCNRGGINLASETEGPHRFLETRFQTLAPTNLVSEISEVFCSAQDQPLTFDRTRLAVASAAFRGPSAHQSSSQTQNLAQMLQFSLPNLNNSPSRQRSSLQGRDSDGAAKSSVTEQKGSIQHSEPAETIPGKPSISETTVERNGHTLGLDCYCSSDEDSDM